MVFLEENNFHTLKGYEILESKKITYAMEDYLEMICRMCKDKDYVRINELSKNLNVRPSSVSKMVYNLRTYGLVDFEKYGYIKPTNLGKETGEYLIYRHEVLQKFLCHINKSKDELEQVEKIEHYLNRGTIKNIEILCRRLWRI